MAESRICSAPGCDKPSRSGGLCNMHEARMRRGGSLERRVEKRTLGELLNGQTQFGYWTVLREGVGIPRPGNGVIRTALCRCECGAEREVVANTLKRGLSRNCGCRTGEMIAASETTHGMSLTPEHKAWCKMKERCLNPNSKDFADYGGRGIRIHPDWISSFEAFFAYLGKKPSSEHSIDRIDPNGNYEPGNVRWADKFVQSQNRRGGRSVLFRGATMPLAEACRLAGANYKRVHSKMQEGMSFEEAIVERPRGRPVGWRKAS